MDPTKFDDLTKALATTTSRRQALKTIAATTLGGILGLSGIGTAFGKNKTCAQWCAAVFGDNTPADEQCASDAAHGGGLCYSCGPASSNGGVAPSDICCARNASGLCSSYSGAQCPCNTSQCLTCDSTTGTCVGCPSGQTCSNGACVTPRAYKICVCRGFNAIASYCSSLSDCEAGLSDYCTSVCAPNGGVMRSLCAPCSS